MPLSEEEKRILREKYRQSLREAWGIRTRKRDRAKISPSRVPAGDEAQSPSRVSILRRAEEEEVPAPLERGQEAGREDSEPLITLEPVAPVDDAVASEGPPEASDASTTSETLHAEARRYVQRQLLEQHEEERQTVGAGKAPRLVTPPRRRPDKGEQEFWEEAPPEETGISLGVALLIILGCIGVVAIGVLLGYVLTAF